MPKTFNSEEIAFLEKHCHVTYISDTTVKFTDEFKELYARLRLTGFTTSEIYKLVGIPEKMLGASRINSLDQSLTAKAKKIGVARKSPKVKRLSVIKNTGKKAGVITKKDYATLLKNEETYEAIISYLEEENNLIKKATMSRKGKTN